MAKDEAPKSAEAIIPAACYARLEALPPPLLLNIEEEVGLRFPVGPPW